MPFNPDRIAEILIPYQQPFSLSLDGTSQTHVKNTGRFGYFVERLFDIKPNRDRGPDLHGVEIKTVQIRGRMIRPVSIGTIPRQEHAHLVQHDNTVFEHSDPYRKMRRTLWVFYQKHPGQLHQDHPAYAIQSWCLTDLDCLDPEIQQQLQSDYAQCVDFMRSHTYEQLCKLRGAPRTRMLGLSFKGDAQYTYPSWKFKTAWLRCVHERCVHTTG